MACSSLRMILFLMKRTPSLLMVLCSSMSRRRCSSSVYQTPLADVREPAFAALLLDDADEVEVGEGVVAAEDLADDPDERPEGVVVGLAQRKRSRTRTMAGTDRELFLVRDANRDRLADLLEALVVHGVRRALLRAGAAYQQHLHEDVLGRHPHAPGSPDEVLRVHPDRRVAIIEVMLITGMSSYPRLVELGADQVQVLPNRHGPLASGIEEGDVTQPSSSTMRRKSPRVILRSRWSPEVARPPRSSVRSSQSLVT